MLTENSATKRIKDAKESKSVWSRKCLMITRSVSLIQLMWRQVKVKVSIDRNCCLRTTVPFATAHLEIFHCTHHPVITKSDLYFTFCSTLNALS